MATVAMLTEATSPVALTSFSAEDLLKLPNRDLFELVNGKLVEKHMSQESSWVGLRLGRFMGNFAEDEHELGWVFGPDCGYQCFLDAPNKVRKPDVSFVSRRKLPECRFTEGHVRVPPDLAVEVVSPNDTGEEVITKVEEYLAAGVQAVWVIFPRTRVAQVFRQNGYVAKLHEDDVLSDEELLPGFHCVIHDILPLPAEVAASVQPEVAAE